MKNRVWKYAVVVYLFGFAAGAVNAQSVYFEDFESGGGNWSADNGLWEVGLPSPDPDDCHEGVQCAATVLEGHYPDNTDSRFISPSILLPAISGDQEIVLRFWHAFHYHRGDRGQVQISFFDENSGQWSDWEDVGSQVNNVSPIWSLKSVDISDYQDSRVRIAFFHIADSFANTRGWFIDDVEVKTIPIPANVQGLGNFFVPLKPQARILDTRRSGDITSGAPVGAGQTVVLKTAGVSGIPDEAVAVQLNVTVVQGTTNSFLTVWDEGPWPGTSSLNWDDAGALPNAVTTAIGADGKIRIFNAQGTVHVIVDVVGYYVPCCVAN